MGKKFYQNNREYVEDAIKTVKETRGDHDAQFWASIICLGETKLIDYFKFNPRDTLNEIFSNLKVCKEYYYWDDSCGGVMTSGHHRRVHVKLIEHNEVIRACQEYLDKLKEA